MICGRRRIEDSWGRPSKGYSCGGRAYGYRRVPIEDPSKRDEYGRPIITAVRWEPDAKQAKWVRWIFERYAAGSSPRDIAAELNQLGVPSPRGGTWCASAIHGDPTDGTGILCNTRYAGRLIWNRFDGSAIRDEETDTATPTGAAGVDRGGDAGVADCSGVFS